MVTSQILGYVQTQAQSASGAFRAVTADVSIPAGETGTINVTLLNPDGTPYGLAGAQVLFTAWRNGVIVISRQATISNPGSGTCFIPLVVADTINLTGQFSFDVWVTDSSGNRYQAVGPSNFLVTPALGQPNQAVTVPASQAPLAVGPPGLGLTPTAVKTALYAAALLQLVRCNPSAGAFNVTLPAAAVVGVLAVYNQSSSANAVTVLPAGTDTILGGAAGLLVQARELFFFYSDGVSDWAVK